MDNFVHVRYKSMTSVDTNLCSSESMQAPPFMAKLVSENVLSFQVFACEYC